VGTKPAIQQKQINLFSKSLDARWWWEWDIGSFKDVSHGQLSWVMPTLCCPTEQGNQTADGPSRRPGLSTWALTPKN